MSVITISINNLPYITVINMNSKGKIIELNFNKLKQNFHTLKFHILKYKVVH